MTSRATILEHLIDPERADLTQELAHYLLGLQITPADQAKYDELAEKCAEGALTSEEQWELDQFLLVNDFLAILKSKARTSLEKQNSSAA
jgi:hypothetical protein